MSESIETSMFHAAVRALAEISGALHIPDDQAACANGNELILEALTALEQRANDLRDRLLAALERAAAAESALVEAKRDIARMDCIETKYVHPVHGDFVHNIGSAIRLIWCGGTLREEIDKQIAALAQQEKQQPGTGGGEG